MSGSHPRVVWQLQRCSPAPAGDPASPRGDVTAPAGGFGSPRGGVTVPAGHPVAAAGDVSAPTGEPQHRQAIPHHPRATTRSLLRSLRAQTAATPGLLELEDGAGQYIADTCSGARAIAPRCRRARPGERHPRAGETTSKGEGLIFSPRPKSANRRERLGKPAPRPRLQTGRADFQPSDGLKNNPRVRRRCEFGRLRHGTEAALPGLVRQSRWTAPQPTQSRCGKHKGDVSWLVIAIRTTAWRWRRSWRT